MERARIERALDGALVTDAELAALRARLAADAEIKVRVLTTCLVKALFLTTCLVKALFFDHLYGQSTVF